METIVSKKGVLETFRTQSFFKYGCPVDLPLCFELYQESFKTLPLVRLSVNDHHTSTPIQSVNILQLCKSGYSLVISILVIAQGFVLNIRGEEIIKCF